MAANTVDTEDVRYSLTSTVTITIHAATKPQVVAISVVIAALLGQLGAYFVADSGLCYRNPELRQITDLQPFKEQGHEKIGAYRRAIIWSMAKDYLFPPLFAEAEAPAYFSVHDSDSVDAWGNHGRVIAEADEE